MADEAVQFHATKQLMLDTVSTMFETTNPGSLTSEQVLAKARVSSGSMYHHFEDFSDLIEQALCIEYEKYTSRTIDILLEVNEQSKTVKQFAKGLAEARSISYGPAHERNRILRIWAIAYASDSDRMCQRLGKVQERLNAKFATFIKGGQDLGFFSKEVDPLLYGVFVQAYNLGTVITNLPNAPIENDVWMKLLDRVSQKTIVNLN